MTAREVHPEWDVEKGVWFLRNSAKEGRTIRELLAKLPPETTAIGYVPMGDAYVIRKPVSDRGTDGFKSPDWRRMHPPIPRSPAFVAAASKSPPATPSLKPAAPLQSTTVLTPAQKLAKRRAYKAAQSKRYRKKRRELASGAKAEDAAGDTDAGAPEA